MYSMTSFKDLQNEIALSKIRIEYINEQKQSLNELMYAFTSPVKELRAMVYDDMPKGGAAVEYERLVEGMTKLENMIDIEERILLKAEETEAKINDRLKSFEGIEYKVAYLIQCQGYTVQEVADELGYSFYYIQNISAKVNKEVNI